MLVLTRKRAEMIHIGEDVVIKVIKTGRSSVKIGIEAPDDVRVLRAELCQPQLPPPKFNHRDFHDAVEAEPRGRFAACSDQFPHVV